LKDGERKKMKKRDIESYLQLK